MSIFRVVLLLLACSVTLLNAQVTTGTLYGTVLDSSGAAVPGANVTVANEETVQRKQVVTDARGEFVATFLPPGRYSVSIEMTGFRTQKETGIALVAGQDLRREFVLAVGSVGETVTVTAEAPLVNAVNAQQNINLTETSVRELPLQRRNLNNLVNLAPGVMSGQDVGVSINGLPPRGFLFTIDGVNAAGDSELRSLGMYQDFNTIKGISIEAIEQVQVAKNVFSAEVSNTIGGNVNLITKRGTNQYHGSAFWNYQSGGLNAANAFSGVRESLVWNQFGGSLGGPIMKNKMFAFGAYEGYRLTAMRALSGNVPTQALRDAVIAAQPSMRQIMELFPLPTVATPAGADVGLHRGTTAAASGTENHVVVRWDYNLTPGNILTLRYKRMRPGTLSPRMPIINPQTQVGASENGAASFITARGNWTAETRMSYNRDDMDRVDQFWNSGLSGGISLSSGFNTGETRVFIKSGSSTTVEEVVATQRGRHSLKFGGTYQRSLVGRQDQDLPIFSYQTRADLLANQPTGVAFRYGVAPWQMTSWQLGGFVQDDIRVTPRLMMNLGLRYDYYSVPRERDDRIFNRDGAFGPYRPPDSAWNAQYRQFSPRVGFAWRLDDKGNTVLRTGYGVFFSRQNLFSGPVELVKTVPGLPVNVNFSAAEVRQYGLKFGDTRERISTLIQAAPLITDLTIDPNWKNPYSQQWTLGIQRQLTGSMVLDVAYVGSRGLRLPMTLTQNRVDRITGQRPVAGFGQFDLYKSIDMSTYTGLQTSLEKRMSRDLSFAVNYTWASNMAYFRGDMHCCGGGEQPQELNDIRSNRGPTTFAIKHTFNTHWVYELPFTRMLQNSSRAAKLALGGWQLSGIFGARTGGSANLTQTSTTPVARPDYVGGDVYYDGPDKMQYLNTAAFAQVPLHPVSRATIRPGNVGHRAIWGPGSWDLDVAASKRLRFTEGVSLQLRIDMFNALNHTPLSGFSTSINANNFGRFTSTRPARTIQLNGRLTF